MLFILALRAKQSETALWFLHQWNSWNTPVTGLLIFAEAFSFFDISEIFPVYLVYRTAASATTKRMTTIYQIRMLFILAIRAKKLQTKRNNVLRKLLLLGNFKGCTVPRIKGKSQLFFFFFIWAGLTAKNILRDHCKVLNTCFPLSIVPVNHILAHLKHQN